MLCPVCATRGIVASGQRDSRILIVGDHPSETDLKYGKPFSGPTGKIFRKEFMKVIGQDLWMFRICNLWLHEPNKDENCLSVGHDLVLEESNERDIIVLIGSEAVSHFVGLSVSDISGMVVESEFFPDATVFCMLSPGLVFNRGRGELDFSLKQLKKLLDEKELL